MNDSKNPLSPHLQIYRWHISSLISITQRISSVINLLAIIVLGFLIGQTLSFSVNYKRGKFLKLIAVISFITGIILIIVINKLLLINLFSIYGAASIIIGTYLSVDKF